MNTCPVYRAVRRAELRRDLFRSDRPHHRSDLQCAQVQQSALLLDAERQLHQRVPGENQYPRANLRLAEGLVAAHETPFVKSAAIKAAGVLMARPAAYRAAVEGANMALANLPRFVIYNGLNAWGNVAKRPHPPARPSMRGTRKTAEAEMSSRDAILAPYGRTFRRPNVPLPEAPLFDGIRRPRCSRHSKILERMGGIVGSARLRRGPRACHGKIEQSRQVACSTRRGDRE